ncbi:50S ribosomal protein L13 [Desulfonatronovibrio hydrogenovorans]|uniref:50S ribosomal protein L13 n=1 Tax=Desulfonatronovibrio hydrogenovorans TaxID=53245 RepID=UPI00048A9569|nr:50S ribosomal protein L13 [Desulfonatronovibrio hydrogenovorans]
MKTYSPKPQDAQKNWQVIDAKDKILGRMATEIAVKLRGKDKPEFAPHMDMGDFVIVVNADKIRVTGNKLEQKKYHRHTGYPGGIKEISLAKLLEKKPEEVIRHSVRGMLPKNKIGRQLLKKLKIYAGPDHPHTAQQPVNQES